jgi:hypothetical protein
LLGHRCLRTLVAASNATFDEIINHENLWMAKLGTLATEDPQPE